MLRHALRRNRLFGLAMLGLGALLLGSTPAGAQGRKPLEPVDTSSPRATLTTFLEAMNDAVGMHRDGAIREDTRARIADAVRCLDLSEVPPSVADAVGFETALRLKEVLDRIHVPAFKRIPAAAQMEENLSGIWTLPDTPIAIAQVTEGPRSGEYLFSPQTVERSQEFYDRVLDLPYRRGTTKGAHYEEYQRGSGEFLSGWVSALPEWTKEVFKGQAVWQWAGLLLCLALGFALTGLLYAGGHRIAARRPSLGAYVLPLTLMGMSVLLDWAARKLHLTGGVFAGLALIFTALFFFGGVRLVAVVLGQIASLIIATSHLRPSGMDSQLVRLASRLVILVVTVALVVAAADQLGLPAYSLLTGLGIGGLAVALAARETLANFLASVVIMFERPFRVGDWIKVAGHEGNVEDVGFRSTRIRTFYNSLVTIPSSEMVNVSIDNMGMRRFRRVRTVLQITYDTPSEKIEAFVEGIRELIRTHPTTRKDTFHVVFNDFGAHSLDILVYFFLIAPDWGKELRERQSVLLEIVRLAEDLGVRFAFPTRTLHLESVPEEAGELPQAGLAPAASGSEL